LLVVDILARTQGEPEINLKCTLEKFALNLFGTGDVGFLVINFKGIEFSTQNGKKPEVKVDFDDIKFAGPLSFIETLKNLIPLDAFSDPPKIDVDASGITASMGVGLPAVAVGVFSLSNIKLAASLRIPFVSFGSDGLTFDFNFSTRDDPFNLTIALLGGGGYFGLEVTPNGVRFLEAALEAGARVSIDLGVASGSVSAMLGIYFRIEIQNPGTPDASSTKELLTLTGYFRVRGEVDVLGLISASITLSLSLSYQSDGKVRGTASLEIEVDVLFFSETVTVTCQRTFAGSNGDPSFLDVMRPQGDFRPWDDYIGAFAA